MLVHVRMAMTKKIHKQGWDCIPPSHIIHLYTQYLDVEYMYIGEVTQYTAVHYTYMYMYTVPALYCACSDGYV